MPLPHCTAKRLLALIPASLASLALISLSARAQDEAQSPERPENILGIGKWSKMVDGLQARALVIDNGYHYEGTHLLCVYLELRNVSDVLGDRIVYYDPSCTASGALQDATGKTISLGGVVMDRLTPPPSELALPHNSNLRFPISWGGYGIKPGTAAMIEAWSITPGDNKAYQWKATFASKPTTAMTKRYQGGNTLWAGTFDIPPVPLKNLGSLPPP